MKTVSKDRVKRFDFRKKPHKPSFLLGVAKGVISWPDLKKRGARIEKIDMEELEGKPYLLLVTHSSMVDFNLMLKATHPYPVNNVMTLEGFNEYTEPLMRHLGVLGKRKFVTDINLIRNMKYCLHELKTIFTLFPETRYSLDGCTSFLPDSLGGLVRMMNVPVAMLKIRGNFVTSPHWSHKNKGIAVEADMFPIVKPDRFLPQRACQCPGVSYAVGQFRILPNHRRMEVQAVFAAAGLFQPFLKRLSEPGNGFAGMHGAVHGGGFS
jgi:hypothetical protein